MAYGVVYDLEFYDDNADLVVIYVMQDGYAGATTVINGGDEPCIIRMLGEGDEKYAHIRATEAIMQFVSTSSLQYLSLFLASNKTYLVKILVNGDVKWYGWVNPEYYSEPFVYPPYITQVTATDGLALLKNVRYPVSDYATKRYTLIDYIATCLRQIGFPDTMQIKVAVNLGANVTSGYEDARVMEKLLIDYRTFRSKDIMAYCYDVLVEILSTLNARLVQWENAWWVLKVDQQNDDFRVEVYDMDGVYVSTTAAFDSVFALTSSVGAGNDIRFLHGAELGVSPAARRFTIAHEYGLRTNISAMNSYEGLFYPDEFSGGVPINWTANTSEVVLSEVPSEQAMKMLNIVGGGLPTSYAYIETNLGDMVDDLDALMTAWYAGEIQLHLKYKVRQAISGDLTKLTNAVHNAKLSLNCSGNIYYWEDDPAGWGAVTNNLSYNLINNLADWYEMDIEVPLPPPLESGVTQTYLKLLFRFSDMNVSASDLTGYQAGDGMMINNFRIYFEPMLGKNQFQVNEETDKYDELLSWTVDSNNLLEPDDYKIKYAESPAPYDSDGYGLINRYVIFDLDGKPVNQFTDTRAVGIGGTPTVHQLRRLTYLISDELAATYRRPLFTLRGILIDKVGWAVNLYSCLKDYNDRYYIPTGIELNMKTLQHSGEWLQIYDDSGTGEFNDDFNEDFWI